MSEKSHTAYLMGGCKPRNGQVYDEMIRKIPGHWRFVDSREELTVNSVRILNPCYIFFLHWSWNVPEEIIEQFECMCFHLGDVSYGHGGGPLRNPIARKRALC